MCASIKNQDYLNDKLIEYSRKMRIKEHTEVYFIFDNLRHVFVVYCIFGLRQAYKNREAENWYPKIIIRQKLPSKMDCEQLDDEIVIYRGMSEEEYLGNSYGQSWTTDIDTAEKFAYQHYSEHSKYEGSMRVVAKTKINKKNIYYCEVDDEKEIIIDERRIHLDNVKLYNKGMIQS